MFRTQLTLLFCSALSVARLHSKPLRATVLDKFALCIWLAFAAPYSAVADENANAPPPSTNQTEPERTKKINIYDESDIETSEPVRIRKHFLWFKHGPSFWKLRYYFSAQNAKDCEFFYGLIQDNPLLGRASVDFNSGDGCKCHGVAQVTHIPLKGGGANQRGYIHVKCEDGRKMHGHFATTSLTTGTADLTDDKGNSYQATFGHSADQAIDRSNALRKQLGCPELTAQDVETKVNGEYLPNMKKQSKSR